VIIHIRSAQNAIELIEYGRESGEVDYAQRIQTFHRFLIEHISQEGNAFSHNPIINNSVNDPRPPSAPITQLLGFDGKNLITCLDCNATREKEMVTHVIDLTYPRKASYQNYIRWRLSDSYSSQMLMNHNLPWISRQLCVTHCSVI
jgi:PAB-dependent poly(A)-specific ribonuclease subunit 2